MRWARRFSPPTTLPVLEVVLTVATESRRGALRGFALCGGESGKQSEHCDRPWSPSMSVRRLWIRVSLDSRVSRLDLLLAARIGMPGCSALTLARRTRHTTLIDKSPVRSRSLLHRLDSCFRVIRVRSRVFRIF